MSLCLARHCGCGCGCGCRTRTHVELAASQETPPPRPAVIWACVRRSGTTPVPFIAVKPPLPLSPSPSPFLRSRPGYLSSAGTTSINGILWHKDFCKRTFHPDKDKDKTEKTLPAVMHLHLHSLDSLLQTKRKTRIQMPGGPSEPASCSSKVISMKYSAPCAWSFPLQA